MQKKKVTRTIRILGRHLVDIQREEANAKFEVPVYPEPQTLYQIGLEAIGQLSGGDPKALAFVQKASQRDTGVKHMVNDILTHMQNKMAQAVAQEEAQEATVAQAPENCPETPCSGACEGCTKAEA